MDLSLGDKVAIITGSSRGLGLASARALVAEGCRVCICARGSETLAEAAGYNVTVWDAATWASKTPADFEKFSAIVFPDAFDVTVGDCATNPSLLATAEANRATWSPSVNGPAVIIGTDPIYHQIDRAQAVTMMSNAIKFAVS